MFCVFLCTGFPSAPVFYLEALGVLLADSLIVTVYYLFVLRGFVFVGLGGLLFGFYSWLWDAGGGGISGGFVYARGILWGGGRPRWCEVVGAFCLLFRWLSGGGVG